MKTSATAERILCIVILLAVCVVAVGTARATTVNVEVGPGSSLTFSPFSVTIQPGDTVTWTWKSSHHSVTSGMPGQPTSLFNSGILGSGSTFSFTFIDPGTYGYYCIPHGNDGMVGNVVVEGASPSPTPSPTPCPSITPRPASQAQLLNISTRMRVQSGDNVLIGGFIITGSEAKEVVLRAIGPSLSKAGVADALADPILELHALDGSLIVSNDNWKETQEAEIEASGFAPQDDLESVILTTLEPNAYTAIVRGKGGSSGVGLVEGYDLDQAANSQFANISTRGFVETGSNVMIGGFILGNGDGDTNVLVRALGPSLTDQGVAGAMADPTLELRDVNGALVQSNDNWKETEGCLIEGTGLAPQDDLESALIETIAPGAYTAIVAGKDGLTGVALVEVYRLP